MNQLQEIAGLTGGVLGGDLIGTYLHGSSVLGGLRPASDVDVLLVSRRSMGERERRALLGGLPPEHRPVLDHARQLCLNCRYSEESWSGTSRAQARPRVDHVLAEIDRLSPRAPGT
ncbi:nucleotidyltransferase domain-containing protein [Streptomyces tsukubensis]|uniref:Polymerase nucleotidyl transferase domain-containing protein n=1 Tax=Streptomyces tsukubensis TaxID=83656 RepID=A0A1V4A828_9ACTN|nr:nucleotidyltransferase domain-containing protein [Streptomyces tsukubensis]OON77990.1 hypothetical protein B1H18_17310 [Streptomyces tsukubensis]QFR97154.1 hypothetical protein GBW32_33965 [Streptomyces tsukubensis]